MIRSWRRSGRNEPCACGSGLKAKLLRRGAGTVGGQACPSRSWRNCWRTLDRRGWTSSPRRRHRGAARQVGQSGGIEATGASVIALRDRDRPPRQLAAVALIDLASGSRQLVHASVIQWVAVRAAVVAFTPSGLLLAA